MNTLQRTFRSLEHSRLPRRSERPLPIMGRPKGARDLKPRRSRKDADNRKRPPKGRRQSTGKGAAGGGASSSTSPGETTSGGSSWVVHGLVQSVRDSAIGRALGNLGVRGLTAGDRAAADAADEQDQLDIASCAADNLIACLTPGQDSAAGQGPVERAPQCE